MDKETCPAARQQPLAPILAPLQRGEGAESIAKTLSVRDARADVKAPPPRFHLTPLSGRGPRIAPSAQVPGAKLIKNFRMQ
jgi:hypothetical protein